MRHSMGMVLVAVLALLLSGCEQKEPQVQEEPAEETRPAEEEATQEEKSALPDMNERIEEEAERGGTPESSEPIEDDTAADTQQSAEAEKPDADGQAADGGQTTDDTAAGERPETVTYDASFGAVTFDHAAHSEMLECGNCHTTDPPQRITLDKDSAHDLCKGCHEEQGAGPTGCRGCHVKE